MRCSKPKSNESSAQAFSFHSTTSVSHYLLQAHGESSSSNATYDTRPSACALHSSVKIKQSPISTYPPSFHNTNCQSIRKRPQIQPPHLQPKRVVPRVAPRGVQVQPAAHTVVE